MIGRRRPSRRDAADIETGLAAVTALAPFATGAGAVVVRHYMLAIEAAEGVMAMLERAAALRQWGLRWRKVGVLVRRAEEPTHGSERARGAAGPGRGAGAGRHCRDGAGRRARRLRGRRPGSPTITGCSWCCARYDERKAGALRRVVPMTSDDDGMRERAYSAEGQDLRLFMVAGEHSGDALGAKLMAALERAPPRPHPLPRRRRRADGGSRASSRSFRWRTWR